MLQYFAINQKEVKQLVKQPLAPRQRDYHELMWIEEGVANFLLDGDVYSIESNAFFVFPKGRIHQFLPKEAVKGQVIRFTEDVLDDYPRLLFSKFNQVSQVKISIENQTIFAYLFKVLSLEYTIQPTYSPVLTNLLKTIIYKLDDIKQRQLACTTTAAKINLDVFDRFQLLLDEYITQETAIAFYAEKLHLSQRQLGNIVKQVLNKPTSVVIAERLLIACKRQLLYTNHPISQVAYSMGFEDNSYFTKFFKKHTQQTPKEYRKNHITSIRL